MRILHLTTFLQGGAGRAITDLAVEQRRQGHDVAVVTSETAPGGYGNYPAYIETLARERVRLHLVDSMFTRDLADTLHVVAFVARQGLLQGVSVMHAHAAIPSHVAFLLRGVAGRHIPVVQTMHGWGVAKTGSQQRSDVTLLDMVDRLVVPAPSSVAVLRAAGVRRPQVSVVPYGVSAEGPTPESYDLLDDIRRWRGEGRVVVTCVGTIGARKNQRVVLEALAHVDDPSRLMCLFVGDGDASGLQASADELGVSHLVHVAGYRGDARLLARASDWFLLPSLSEGQPLSILEAFCDRTPVLASDIPEIAEMVEDGTTGLLFDPARPGSVATALERAVDLPEASRSLLTGRAAMAYQARHTREAMTGAYMREYAAALAGLALSHRPAGAVA